MKPEFGCRLNQVQLCKRLTSGKRPQDSWSDYLDYLKYVSRLMTGDHSLPLLENFGANACPDLTSVLVPHIDRSNGNYLSEADRILALLVDLRGDDRKRPQIARTPESSKQHETKIRAYQQQKPQHHAGQKQQKQSHPTGQGQALAAAAKPTPKLVCYVCDKEDHRGRVRLELKKLKRLVKEHGQAHNAAVTSTDRPVDATNQAADGGLWLSASDMTAVAEEWILDSAATHHLCTNTNLLFGVELASLKIKIPNSDTITGNLKGNCLLRTNVDGVDQTVLPTEVYYCENLCCNLLSLSQLRQRGLRFIFDESAHFTEVTAVLWEKQSSVAASGS
ncbi:hypothetical protein PR003_g4119 [Phytophthora rubi]|uniref:Retrovirus-related Pol polyprotein from transposon TNT 1-94-like beta-barrel domain-containing protein n=1 Tax=Phytophthora rubi TaxID=129364 RepID=A0A6A4FXM2_9STRA|nr:hypothetical protein PR003_g4119 [Phytophthora rubi]